MSEHNVSPTSSTDTPAKGESLAAALNPADDVGSGSGGSTSLLSRFTGSSAMRNSGLVLALLLLCIVGYATSGERFANVDNMLTILRMASIIGVLSIGMTFVITAGGIDLSVGAVLGLASVWSTTLATQAMANDIHWSIMVGAAMLVGLVVGFINGIVIAYGNVVAFIATLATMLSARGLAEIIANRKTQKVIVPGFSDFFAGSFLGIPALVWVFIVVSAAGWILLNRTTFGRRTIAVGGNPEAARLAGIKVKRHLVYVYGLAGLCAGIAGTMMVARTTTGASTNGYLYELDAIAAVVVGGTLLIGGRGTIVGTVLGVLIFNVLINVFVQNNLTTSVQAVAKGVIIVGAVLLQQRFAARGRS